MPRGRRRKAGHRHKCGKLKQGQFSTADRGTPEMQALRQATTQDRNLSPDYPLSILLGRGLLVAKGEDPQLGRLRHDAGMRFARDYWFVFGQPFAGGSGNSLASLSAAAPSGSTAPRGHAESVEMHSRRRYEEALIALGGLGAVTLLKDLCIFLKWGWLIQELLDGTLRRKRHTDRLQRIRDALDALRGDTNRAVRRAVSSAA